MMVVGFVMLGFCVVGTLRYDTLRAKWSNVIGVFGSYVVLLGVMLFVELILAVITDSIGVGLGETIGLVIVMLICLGYLAVLEIKLPTTKQRILLPFVAILIGCGFCWKFVWAIITRSPMGGGRAKCRNA